MSKNGVLENRQVIALVVRDIDLRSHVRPEATRNLHPCTHPCAMTHNPAMSERIGMTALEHQFLWRFV
jgi:hypothetical protein